MKLNGVMVIAAAIAVAAGSATAGVTCQSYVEGWEKLQGQGLPRFLLDGDIVVEELLVCDDGIYWVFREREGGSVHRFCLVDRSRESTRAEAGERIARVVGRWYRDNDTISFKKQRKRATLKFSESEPVTFAWRGERARFVPEAQREPLDAIMDEERQHITDLVACREEHFGN